MSLKGRPRTGTKVTWNGVTGVVGAGRSTYSAGVYFPVRFENGARLNFDLHTNQLIADLRNPPMGEPLVWTEPEFPDYTPTLKKLADQLSDMARDVRNAIDGEVGR